jgi:hypothetical protein
MARATRRLGQHLIARGWLDRAGLDRALATQSVVGGHLGTCLLELDLVDEEKLERALSELLHVPAVGVDDLRNVPAEVVRLVPRRLALRHRAVPVRASGSRLDIAMLETGNLGSLDELSFACGRRISPHTASEPRIVEALERYYDEDCPPRIARLVDRLNRVRYLWSPERAAAAPAGAVDPAAELFPISPEFLPPPLPEAAPPPRPAGRAARAKAAPPPSAAAAAKPASAAVAAPTAPLSAAEAGARIAAAGDRDEIGALVVSFLLQDFRRVGLFGVLRDHVVGWMGAGPGCEPELLAAFTLPLDQPSIFLNLDRGSAFHVGPLAAMPAHRKLARCWGGEPAEECLLMPIRIGERLVAVIYADRAPGPLGGVDLEETQLLAGRAAAALERCIVLKKQRQTSPRRR